MNKKRNIGLFFGSFNPVHIGHIKLAEYLYHHTSLDEIWLVVSPQNPLKAEGGLADEGHRLAMLKLAVATIPFLHVSDIEFSLSKPSYTYRTLSALSQKYAENDFTLIIGSDNMLIFDRWRNYREILQHYRVLVYPRKGYEASGEEMKFPTMELVDAPYYEISSTQVRKLIADREDFSEYVPLAVAKYLEENRLYE